MLVFSTQICELLPLVSTISDILAVAGLLSSVCLLSDVPTVCSGGSTADDIHDVPVVTAAAAISNFNSVPAVAGLRASFCQVILRESLLLLASILC
jgi:hypothetical protein